MTREGALCVAASFVGSVRIRAGAKQRATGERLMRQVCQRRRMPLWIKTAH